MGIMGYVKAVRSARTRSVITKVRVPKGVRRAGLGPALLVRLKSLHENKAQRLARAAGGSLLGGSVHPLQILDDHAETAPSAAGAGTGC